MRFAGCGGGDNWGEQEGEDNDNENNDDDDDLLSDNGQMTSAAEVLLLQLLEPLSLPPIKSFGLKTGSPVVSVTEWVKRVNSELVVVMLSTAVVIVWSSSSPHKSSP